MSEKAELSRYVTKKQLRALLGDGVSGGAGNTMVTNNYNLANVTQLGDTSIVDASSTTILIGGGGGGGGDARWATPGLAVTSSQPSRLFNTTYQNTSGAPMIVAISADLRVAVAAGSAILGTAGLNARVEDVSPPTNGIVSVEESVSLGGLSVSAHHIQNTHELSFVVPDDYYYRVETSITGDGVLPVVGTWEEYTLSITLT